MMSNICYKKFKINPNNNMLYSAVVIGNLEVEYRVDEWAYGYMGTPLFAYANEKFARRDKIDGFIFECEFDQYWMIQGKRLKVQLLNGISDYDLIKFWNSDELDKEFASYQLPAGNMLVRGIRPICPVARV